VRSIYTSRAGGGQRAVIEREDLPLDHESGL